MPARPPAIVPAKARYGLARAPGVRASDAVRARDTILDSEAGRFSYRPEGAGPVVLSPRDRGRGKGVGPVAPVGVHIRGEQVGQFSGRADQAADIMPERLREVLQIIGVPTE